MMPFIYSKGNKEDPIKPAPPVTNMLSDLALVILSYKDSILKIL